MAISNTSYILKEWAPLTDLLNKIPSKPNLSIFSEEVKITCVEILPEFIALGTNYGIAYWYDRKKKELQRLRCENSQVSITAIKVLSTVDYMLACGGKNGNISIFQIPKTHPEWIPENLKPKNKTVERYMVSDLHKSQITALEWSKNGMKLFSGDKNGTIVLTEMDFFMHICKSLEILNESYEVVQLSYSKPYLVISTTYRTIICEKTNKWNVVQVGQKDRKILGTFGGIIQPDKLKIGNALIYCTRPGLRIWVSDCQGNVQKTLLFKELLNKDCTEVPLLNPVTRKLQTFSTKEINFGVLKPFGENLLVTHSNAVVYILDPNSMTIVSKISHLRSVLDVVCHKDEIFILEEDRNLIRISTKPELNYELNNISSMENSYFNSSIRNITSKLQATNILSVIPPVIEQALSYNINEHTDGEIVVNAEEAVECPNRKLEDLIVSRFENIEPEDESKEIIYKHKKYKKKHDRSNVLSHSSQSSNSSCDDIANITRPTVMDMSLVGVLPDLRSPQSIQNDIEYKEKLLADFLNFDTTLCIDNNVQSEQSSVINEKKNLDIGETKRTLNFNCDSISDSSKSNVLTKDEIRIETKELSLNVVCDKSSDINNINDDILNQENSRVCSTKKDSIDGVICTSSTKTGSGGNRSRMTRRKTNDQVSSKPIPIASNTSDPPGASLWISAVSL
ncbi:hypothetical protein WA026_013734 [Henosepilachna vigintioctopunctata]|uniref:HPS5-like beta-propeller domain-containing protein n=1 Tax=Henosepilachna vigintioctopunctata TaxID=420089 RepID=A0AAW1V0T7_9CUCU